MDAVKYCAAACAVVLMIPVAHAQDTSLAPNYGTARLDTGFVPDPRTVSITAGGPRDASRLGNGCAGYVASAPDYRLHFDAGSLPLIIAAESNQDTTLVINGPDGRWYCDDDGSGRLDPVVRFDNPGSGQYDIWVGVYDSEDRPAATLKISELEENSSGVTADYNATPNYGVANLSSGFRPDPYVVNMRAGGDRPASGMGSGCTGYITNAPDLRVNFDAGGLPLIVSTSSSADTTLVINGPDGRWYCDDDSGGGSNARVRFNSPRSGRYEIWVGTYSSGDTQPATLRVSERNNVVK